MKRKSLALGVVFIIIIFTPAVVSYDEPEEDDERGDGSAWPYLEQCQSTNN